MTHRILRSGLILGLAWWLYLRDACAQGPTIDTGFPSPPGSGGSVLGTPPGSGGGTLDNPGGGTSILSGRTGATAPHVPTSVSTPGAGAGVTDQQMGFTAPKPQATPSAPFYGTLSLTDVAEDEGPADGLTLDAAIDRMLKENLDLRAKFYEIPQAQADILQASLRSNPVFYADSQLVPYGQFNRSNAGGPTQYDVNVSYPFDVSHKRNARVVVASRAKRVLEAQYQDAVRQTIDLLNQAYVDVLAARQTLRYAGKSVDGLNKLLSVEQRRFQLDVSTRAYVLRVQIQRDAAQISQLDAEEQVRRAKRTLAVLLNLPPDEAESFEVRGSIFDRSPSPPPIETLAQIALAVRPDIVSYRLGISRAESDVRLALANRFSDVYVLYQPYTYQNNYPYGMKSPISWALGVTVPLPIYNRNQGAIERAKLNVTQTQIQLATLERQALTDVKQALREYEITRKIVEDLERTVIPHAKQVLYDSYRLYNGGEENIVYFLIAQRDFNDTVKQYLDTVVRHRRSMLALNTVLGQRIFP